MEGGSTSLFTSSYSWKNLTKFRAYKPSVLPEGGYGKMLFPTTGPHVCLQASQNSAGTASSVSPFEAARGHISAGGGGQKHLLADC